MLKITSYPLLLLLLFCLVCPFPVQAFWWGDGDNRSGLNLESGYDANTVTAVSGRVISPPASQEQRHVQFELESAGTRIVVVLGPPRYWAENGIDLKVGDSVSVRGSKAQGKDGVVYLLAQKISAATRNSEVSLRNEDGRPAWAGGGMGRSAAGNASRSPQMRQQSPGRMGGGRMGR